MTSRQAGRDGARKRVGNLGEDLAAAFLVNKGYAILERNYRALQAEIDLICEVKLQDSDASGCLVFVEVKTRSTRSHGSPLEAITQEKIALLKRAAHHYLYECGIEDRECRFDVIGIHLGSDRPEIVHVLDVIEY